MVQKKKTVLQPIIRNIALVIFCLALLLLNLINVEAAASGWVNGSPYKLTTADGTVIKIETLTNQGDSTLLTVTKSGSTKYILIDTGVKNANVADKLVSKGIAKIDTLIITHNDGDHINGLKNFPGKVKVSNMYYNYVYSRSNADINSGFDALEYVKSIEDTVITGKATRIRDAKNHSATTYNVNMESDSTAYLRICRGRLFKLVKASASGGYDLTIIPAITDSWTSNNNMSMIVVLETAGDKVIFGGDIQANAMQEINQYKTSSNIDYKPADDYSYYWGIENLLLYNGKYTVYKVSHHGTGTHRVIGGLATSVTAEKNFLNNMKPNALVLTGYGTDVANQAYFNNIYPTAMYTSFTK